MQCESSLLFKAVIQGKPKNFIGFQYEWEAPVTWRTLRDRNGWKDCCSAASRVISSKSFSSLTFHFGPSSVSGKWLEMINEQVMPKKLNGLERNWEVSQLQKKVSKIELEGRMQGTETNNAWGMAKQYIKKPTGLARKDMCRKSRTIRAWVLPDQNKKHTYKCLAEVSQIFRIYLKNPRVFGDEVGWREWKNI